MPIPKFKNEIKTGGWIGASRTRDWSILFLILYFWTWEDDKEYLQRI